MSLTPGIYTMPAAEYHADCAPDPSLSASIAKILLEQSPRHAWYSHPRLNPDFVREEARHMDLGSICHALLLEGADVAVVIDADSYRTKKAQEERDAARLAGKYPILAHEMPEVIAMVQACREQLSTSVTAFDAFDVSNGNPERVLIWKEPNGIWCRARLDWLTVNGWIYDYKTTAGSAHPDALSRRIFQDGWDVQNGFYRRGMRALGYDDPQFEFVCQETFAPYALTVMSLGPAAMELANRKVEYAINKWGECLKTGIWPGYPSLTCAADLPPYEQAKWLERLP